MNIQNETVLIHGKILNEKLSKYKMLLIGSLAFIRSAVRSIAKIKRVFILVAIIQGKIFCYWSKIKNNFSCSKLLLDWNSFWLNSYSIRKESAYNHGSSNICLLTNLKRDNVIRHSNLVEIIKWITNIHFFKYRFKNTIAFW